MVSLQIVWKDKLNIDVTTITMYSLCYNQMSPLNFSGMKNKNRIIEEILLLLFEYHLDHELILFSLDFFVQHIRLIHVCFKW